MFKVCQTSSGSEVSPVPCLFPSIPDKEREASFSTSIDYTSWLKSSIPFGSVGYGVPLCLGKVKEYIFYFTGPLSVEP